MKALKNVMKLVAAAAAVAGIAYLVVKYMDTITAWLKKYCPCCCNEVPAVEEVAEEAPAVEEVPVEEAPAEEAPDNETPAEEVPAEESPVAEGEPVADEADFEA